MAKRKAVFLDKDGTLIPDIPYNVNPELITLEDGVVEGLQLLKEAGYIFVVISNQAGVARGYFQVNDLQKVKQKIDLLLNNEGIEVEKYYFCPHHTQGKIAEYTTACECRKPRPGMILQALKDLDLAPENSWMIGDILNDAEAGNRAGCQTILIRNGNETEWVEGPFRTPGHIAANFLNAAHFILSNPAKTNELNAQSWQECKSILIIRADNMGDLIMSAPAIRALKDSFSSKITVLTSSMAAGIVPFISEIDDAIVFDFPWVKAKETTAPEEIFTLVQQLKQRKFDAVVIFTVFSQNPLPAAMIAYMSAIPLRLAYCRENPYELLTNWVPDKEPYTFIQHQVERDLSLVQSIGASGRDNHLRLTADEAICNEVRKKLVQIGLETTKPWLILHAGVSEKKREYPAEFWVEAAKKLINKKGFQIVFTGAASEIQLCAKLAKQSGESAFATAGLFSLHEFIALVKIAPAVVSVNTATIHIAAAVNTPVVVLYAQTNPQHTPWMVRNKVLEFEVEKESRSKNEVVQFVQQHVYNKATPLPRASEIVDAVMELLDAKPSAVL